MNNEIEQRIRDLETVVHALRGTSFKRGMSAYEGAALVRLFERYHEQRAQAEPAPVEASECDGLYQFWWAACLYMHRAGGCDTCGFRKECHSHELTTEKTAIGGIRELFERVENLELELTALRNVCAQNIGVINERLGLVEKEEEK